MANTKTFGPDMRIGAGTWTATQRSMGVSARAYQDLKTEIHRELLGQIDLERLTSLEDVKARAQLREVIQVLILKLETPLSTVEKERLSREVLHEVFGLGPLEPLLQDPTINDILVNTAKQVYIERSWCAGTHQCRIQRRRSSSPYHRQNRFSSRKARR